MKSLISLSFLLLFFSACSPGKKPSPVPIVNFPSFNLVGGPWKFDTAMITPHNRGQANEYVKGDSIRRIEMVDGNIMSDKRALKSEKWRVY